MGKSKSPKLPATPPQLVLSGGESRIQMVLASEGMVLSVRDMSVAGSANQHLAPAIRDVLAGHGLAASDLSGVACVRGPGGFTGVRMVVATCLGVAQAANIPQAGLDYLPVLAAGPAPLMRGRLGVITHSRTRQVYVQGFECPSCEPLGPPMPVSLEQAAAWAREADINTAVGSGVRKHADFFLAAHPKLHILPEGYDTPLPHALADAATRAQYSHTPVEPLYLRASDAEDNLAAIAAGRGLDADEAKRRLDEATSNVTAPRCGDDS